MKKQTQTRWLLGKAFLFLGVVILSSSFECDGPSGGGSSGGSGGGGTSHQTEEMCRNKLNMMADLPLRAVHLRYDLSAYQQVIGMVSDDLMELEQIHPAMAGLIFNLSGDITNLADILICRDNVVDEERKPLVRAKYSDVECRNYINLSPDVTFTDYMQVAGNVLRNVPAYTTELSEITVIANTVKTQVNNMQIVWSCRVPNPPFMNIVIDDEGEVLSDVSVEMWGVVTSTVNADEVAICRDKETGENTIVAIGDSVYLYDGYISVDTYDSSTPEDDSIAEGDERYPVTPGLDDPVYSGGKVDDSIRWNKPIIYNPLP
jgi:hypothetical protein